MTQLNKDEQFVIEEMRKYKGDYATFRVEKRPTKEHPDGVLVRIVAEKGLTIPS